MIVCLLSSWGSSYLWNFKSRWVTERFSKVLKHFNFSRFFFLFLKFHCFVFHAFPIKVCDIPYVMQWTALSIVISYMISTVILGLLAVSQCAYLCFVLLVYQIWEGFFLWPFFSSNKYFAVFSFLLPS